MKKIIAKIIGLYLNLLAIPAPQNAGRKGFYLFSSPSKTKVKEHQLAFLETAEKSSFFCDGVRIQVYKWGNGDKKILFLHGWQSHSFRWKNYIEAFSKEDHTIYALDAPAHGLSGGRHMNIPIYSDVIESFLYLVQPVDSIVSHSIGSFASLYTLFRIPDLAIKKLVIMGCPGEASDYVKRYTRMLGLTRRTLRATLNAFERITHHLPDYFSSGRFAKAISIPTLIIHDMQDMEAPYHYIPEIHKSLRNSHLITTTGLGHNLRSPEVVKHVMHFVNQPTEDKTFQLVRLHLN
jgi:pimeloyl-ACP methyl ester carboxylesterase